MLFLKTNKEMYKMILSKNKLKEYYNKMPSNKNYEKRFFEISKTYDIFISHSYLDKTEIEALYYIFEECGYTVFIDWKQEELQDRNEVSKEVANKLRKYMANCKSLLYVSTKNSSNSKWCPWELGFVDGLNGRVAILPILNEENNKYKGQEYLGIYPYVDFEKVKDTENYEFWINDPDNPEKYSRLKKWIEDGKLHKYS